MDRLIAQGFSTFASHARSRRRACRARYHGMHHWRGVATLGLELAGRTPAVDPYLVVLFSMFHDLARVNDGVDPEHGPRAAALVRQIGPAALGLQPSELERLAEACHAHSDGHRSDDPTIGACWDADRLTLWRVGTVPQARFLSGEAARSPALFEMSRRITTLPASWRTIRERLEELR